jgi:hypothetical protein
MKYRFLEIFTANDACLRIAVNCLFNLYFLVRSFLSIANVSAQFPIIFRHGEIVDQERTLDLSHRP